MEAIEIAGLGIRQQYPPCRRHTEKFTFVALVHGFGSTCGTLVGLPDDWETLGNVAEEHGFYFSYLYPPYESYERQHFIDTLDDWGWAGDETKAPVWYTGKPWS